MAAELILVPRAIGNSRSAVGSYARLVDRLVLHGAPIDFRDLCSRVVPEATRFLVLDLDRTLHFQRNMGELLGWEICALLGYGAETLTEVEPGRSLGRFLIHPRHPLALAHYLALGARMWAYPGLFYLFVGKVPAGLASARRWTFRAFGHEPVAAAQRVPQMALMHHMSEFPLDTLRELSRRLFARYAGDQIVEREDIAWLRARCPGITIIISSASPKPVLEAAAEALDIDEIIYSDIEEHEGRLSAPWLVDPRFLQPRLPHRIAPPSQVRLNAGQAKIDELRQRHPQIFDPSVVTVGITDNAYGEDHAWAQHFPILADVNTASCFSPIVAHDSPLRELHSASVLTRNERRARAEGAADILDPRRKATPTSVSCSFTRPELTALLGSALARIEALGEAHDQRTAPLREPLAELDLRADAIRAAIETTVAHYNAAPASEQGTWIRELRSRIRDLSALDDERAAILRPTSESTFEITCAIERARSVVDEEMARQALPQRLALEA